VACDDLQTGIVLAPAPPADQYGRSRVRALLVLVLTENDMAGLPRTRFGKTASWVGELPSVAASRTSSRTEGEKVGDYYTAIVRAAGRDAK